FLKRLDRAQACFLCDDDWQQVPQAQRSQFREIGRCITFRSPIIVSADLSKNRQTALLLIRRGWPARRVAGRSRGRYLVRPAAKGAMMSPVTDYTQHRRWMLALSPSVAMMTAGVWLYSLGQTRIAWVIFGISIPAISLFIGNLCEFIHIWSWNRHRCP